MLERVGKEKIMFGFEVLFQHMLEVIAGNQEKPSSDYEDTAPSFQSGCSEYERGMLVART